jgi:hypothetical protein
VYNSDHNEEYVLKEYSKLHDLSDFEPERKHDFNAVLNYLYTHGKKKVVGEYFRAIGIKTSEEEGKDTRRQVCECAHRAFKRWLAFDVRNLHASTLENRIKSRFLFLQIFSVFFRKLVPC